jgi:hypothetical protein
VWSGLYENFDESGIYRLVIYAADNEELKARPKAVQVLVGMDWSVHLPVVLRNN